MRAFLLLVAAFAAQCGTIGSIHVQGNSRFPAAAVVGVSGLKPGISVSPQDLQAAAQRLMDTGLFSSTNYRYVPARSQGKPVIDVTLVVGEITDLRPCRIQIPGTEEESVWAWLAQSEPLVGKRMPANDAAESFYLRAIERFMAERLGRKERMIAKLASWGAVYLFRPEILPKVAALRFEGNQAIPSADLAKALGPVATGSEYTELDFRFWAEKNLRPLYENVGRLRVSFPRVSVDPDASGALTVTTTVAEGALYRIEALDIAAEDLPPAVLSLMDLKPGDVVNWQTVVTGEREDRIGAAAFGYLRRRVADRTGRSTTESNWRASPWRSERASQIEDGRTAATVASIPQPEARQPGALAARTRRAAGSRRRRGFRWELPPGGGTHKVRISSRPASPTATWSTSSIRSSERQPNGLPSLSG